jgi:hypothetical protein
VTIVLARIVLAERPRLAETHRRIVAVAGAAPSLPARD